MKNSCQSIKLDDLDKLKISLQHLIVAIGIKTKTYAEYSSNFNGKLSNCANIVNLILFKERFVVKHLLKVYQMKYLLNQTFNTFLNKFMLENKDADIMRPGQGNGDIRSQEMLLLDDTNVTYDSTARDVEYFLD